MPMRIKLKFSSILAACQFVLAVILLHWGYGTSRLYPGLDIPPMGTGVFLCHGINAPAVLVQNIARIVLPVALSRTWKLYGQWYGIDDLFFFFAVIILWYAVGRKLDRINSPNPHTQMTLAKTALNVFVVLWGACLFYMAILIFRDPGRRGNWVGNTIEGILFLAWSITLVAVYGLRLANLLRHRSSAVADISHK
jgi:hypothetical protein